MSKVFAGYHVVFATKFRWKTITFDRRKLLYAYFYETLKSRGCHTLRINGMRDHVHIAFNLHPSVALADVVRDLKQHSSKWMSSNPDFPYFEGWQEGYYAHSFAYEDRNNIIEYIKSQETHHARFTLIDEMHNFAIRNGLDWYADDWKTEPGR